MRIHYLFFPYSELQGDCFGKDQLYILKLSFVFPIFGTPDPVEAEEEEFRILSKASSTKKGKQVAAHGSIVCGCTI